MSFSNFDLHTRELFGGNILLIVCSLCYLAWWVVAFKPSGAGRGMTTGLLLLAAMVTGVVAVMLTIKGINASPHETTLIPPNYILWGGVAAYAVLLVITGVFFKRQVTSELFLIIGWAMLELSALNALYGSGRFGLRTAIAFSVVIGIAVVVSLVCYVLYYRLGATAGYLDGMIPLMTETLVMAAISVAMVT